MSLHRILITVSTFVAFAFAWTPPAHTKAKHTYEFTIIAEFEEPSQTFDLIPSKFANAPVITSDGTVVYSVGRAFVVSSIFSGDGTATQLLVPFFDHAFRPLQFSVSGNGMLVTNDFAREIIDVHDGTLLGYLDPGDQFFVGNGLEDFYHVSINNRGSVAFTGSIPDRCFIGGLTLNTGLFRFDGETTKTIATFGFLGDLTTVVAFPSINESGRVAFLVPSVGDICPATVSLKGGSLFVGDGKRLTRIAEANSAPALNNRGEVGFIGAIDGASSILVSDGKKTRIIADTTGPFAEFPPTGSRSDLDLPGISINDRGDVAFMAALDTGGVGIFTGPDPFRDKVIATGDSLAGSRVSAIIMSRQNLNNRGQIAFQATLADGRMVVMRAEPVPLENLAMGAR